MKRHLLLALLALPLTAVAGDGLWSRLTFRTDTAYVVRHPYRFTVRPGTGTTFGNLTTRWGAAEERHAHSILSAPVFKVGCNVSVYGLAVGIQRDVAQLLGTRETRDTEFSLSGFSPVIGGDIAYRSSNTHRLSGSTADGDSWRVPFTGSHIRRFLANGYVVCRPRRFSLPAAMTQRHRQIRSAGSPIVGATISGFRMDVDTDALPPEFTGEHPRHDYARCMTYLSASLSGGYAYNWVLTPRWMLHGSYMHSLALYHHGEVTTVTEAMPMGNRLSHGGLLRLGAVWDHDRHFGGFTGTMQMQWMSHTPLYACDYYVHTRLFFGFRF